VVSVESTWSRRGNETTQSRIGRITGVFRGGAFVDPLDLPESVDIRDQSFRSSPCGVARRNETAQSRIARIVGDFRGGALSIRSICLNRWTSAISRFVQVDVESMCATKLHNRGLRGSPAIPAEGLVDPLDLPL
jgi:hypothetical protein